MSDDAHADRAQQVLAAILDEDRRRELADVHPDERAVWIDWQELAAWEADTGLEQVTLEGEPVHDGEYTLADVRGLASDVIARPEDTLATLADALEQLGDPESGRPLAEAAARVHNLPPEASFSVGNFSPARQRRRLVDLYGQVTKRTEVDPAITEAVFKCTGCERRHAPIPQPAFGSFREPPATCDCDVPNQFKSWRIVKEESTWQDYQKLRLQQPPEEALGETKNIDVHVHGDLAGLEEVESGKRVYVTGRVQEVYTGEVVFGKQIVGQAITPEQQVFDEEDLAEYQGLIEDLRTDPDRFDKLVRSVAPDHQGDRLVKEALTLQAFTGGRQKGPGGMEWRGGSHVKLLGDPGTDKTGLLKALRYRVPIGDYVDGPGSSGVGLTASITKDDFSSEQWSIEAGALVKASGGLAAIDEIDKFGDDSLDALHTPLESQIVPVSKAGRRATLTAETKVLAAANPTGGHYDPSREFADQVDVQSPLLSRFDLIFVMREKVDEESVRGVARQMLKTADTTARHERGDLDEDEIEDQTAPIAADEFKAYVAAAERLTPTIEDPAVEDAIVDWYATLKTDLPNRYRRAVREEDRTGEYPRDAPPLPITARKVNAMRRLAAASARLRFSETIEMQDVERVRPYIKRSLADIGIAPEDNEAFASAGGEVDDLGGVGIDA